MRKLSVVYIVGTARSGSTILDLAIGSLPGISSFGELNNLISQGFENREYCSCGAPGDECEFWQHVRSEWCARAGNRTLAEIGATKARIEAPRLLLDLQRVAHSRVFSEYARSTRALLTTLADMTGNTIIVDSSKDPLRALALAQCPGIDLHLVHLVRDPRGVVWSQRKRFRKDLAAGIPRNKRPQTVLRTAVSWCAVNAFADRLRSRHGRAKATLVRYEDFVREPGKTIERIAGPLPTAPPTDEPLRGPIEVRSRHILAGNRMRMSGQVTIRPDAEWPAKLTPRQIRTCELIAGPLMRRYGYRARAAAPVEL